MPEAAELYGVTWHDRGRGQFEAEVDGVKWAIVGGGLTIYRDGTSVTQYKEVSTFTRAAMIVALLARPDAQFELVEWKPIESAPKDGSEVILKDAKGRKESTFWAKNEDGSAGWAEAWDNYWGAYFFHPAESEFVAWAPGIENKHEGEAR